MTGLTGLGFFWKTVIRDFVGLLGGCEIRIEKKKEQIWARRLPSFPIIISKNESHTPHFPFDSPFDGLYEGCQKILGCLSDPGKRNSLILEVCFSGVFI